MPLNAQRILPVWICYMKGDYQIRNHVVAFGLSALVS